MSDLMEKLSANVPFVLTFLGVILVLFVIALLLEKCNAKMTGKKEPIFTTRKTVMIGMFSALAAVLMLFEIPVFFAPGFYKLDFSELPILIGTFAFGPVAGVTMEALKIVLKLLFKSTSTAFVGELANFAVGCSYILPASAVYLFKKNKKGAIAACISGTFIMTVFGTAFNAIYLIPAFSVLFHMPLEAILEMGSAANPLMKEGSLVSLVVCCVAPLNLIKGGLDAIITMLVYKHISPIIKMEHRK